MIGFSLTPSFPLLVLLSLLFLHHHHHHHCHVLAAPSSQDDLAATTWVNDPAAEEKTPLWSWIKTGSVLSSVNRKGGSRSGSRGGGGGGGWKSGKGQSGGGRVPIYAAGGAAGAAGAAAGYAAAGPHNHDHNGAAWNSGNPCRTLALAVLLVIALFFKHFA